MDSILYSPIPAISRSHICASRQSAALDAVGLERGNKLISPSVKMGVLVFWKYIGNFSTLLSWIAVLSICIPRDVHARNR